MIRYLLARHGMRTWHNRVTNLIVVTVMLFTQIQFVSANPITPRIDPSLQQLAAAQPDKVVSIIVQKIAGDAQVDQRVTQLGGTITKDLSLINGFAADMSASAAVQLAQVAGVHWVSLDAPVYDAMMPDNSASNELDNRSEINGADEQANDSGILTLREEFEHSTLGMGALDSIWTGLGAWSGLAWVEIGENDGPDNGDVASVAFLGGTQQGLRLQNAARGIQGFVNLSDAATATLSLAYRRKDMDEATDAVAIEISADNGTTWVALARLTGPDTDPALQIVSYDISAYMTADTTIRFVTSDTFDTLDKFYVDYVEVAYTAKPEAEEVAGVFAQKIFLPLVSIGADDGFYNARADATDAGITAEEVSASSVTAYKSVIDWFDTRAFTNNDGFDTWASNWVEYDPDWAGAGPLAGQVQVNYSALRLDDYPDTWKQPSAARKINLGDNVASAKFSFNFSTSWGVDASDAIAVEVSRNNGLTYTILEIIAGITGEVWQSRSYDISRFASANTVIRFRVMSNYGASDEVFSVGDVEVEYDRVAGGSGWTIISPARSVWKYLDNGSNQGTNWRQPAFDDSTWATGQSELGYGDNDETTYVSYGPNPNSKYPTTYFRRSFYVTNATSFSMLQLGMIRDDGAVVYLNGTEVWRTNMPAGTIAYNTYAATHIEGADERIWHSASIPVNTLVNGQNVIAVEIHQASAASLDNSFELELAGSSNCIDCINTSNLSSTYIKSIGADQLWNGTPRIQGQGITVAVVDSGIAPHDDILNLLEDSRVLKEVEFVSTQSSIDDSNGHGTHIAGTIGGTGDQSNGAHMGVAPKVNLIDVKVMDDVGRGTMSDVVAGLQWIYYNKSAYNIRVVNLSLNSSVAESYHVSPLDAALEILWFNGIVVVVSTGNNGSNANGVLYPPANDPFLISVGATDDKGTASITDDTLATFSAYGTTNDGIIKPDLVAPGKNIISLLASDDSNLALQHPANKVGGVAGNAYFRMSGTSMSSAVVAGAVALLLQDEPNLTPDQVKYRLKATANKNWPGYTAKQSGAGYLDIYAAINGTTTQSSNTGIAAAQLLWTGNEIITWGSVGWGSVAWGSVGWGSVGWGSVGWGSVGWNSVYWDSD